MLRVQFTHFCSSRWSWRPSEEYNPNTRRTPLQYPDRERPWRQRAVCAQCRTMEPNQPLIQSAATDSTQTHHIPLPVLIFRMKHGEELACWLQNKCFQRIWGNTKVEEKLLFEPIHNICDVINCKWKQKESKHQNQHVSFYYESYEFSILGDFFWQTLCKPHQNQNYFMVSFQSSAEAVTSPTDKLPIKPISKCSKSTVAKLGPTGSWC